MQPLLFRRGVPAWLALVVSLVRLSAAESGGTQTEARYEASVTRRHALNYLLHLPREYATQTDRRWPLILFLHGAGERGTDVQWVAKHGPPKLAAAGQDLPAVIVSPQCPANQRWDDAVLLGLLDHVLATRRIDTNRVSLTGLSMGGYGTWSLGLRHPERFSALAPICGGGNIIDILLSGPRGADLKKMPIRVFHGAKDPVVPLAESQRLVDALRRGGHPSVELTVYPEAGHDSWSETYANPEFFRWILAQTREGR